MGLFLFRRNKSEIKVPTTETENPEEERFYPPGWLYENRQFIKELEDNYHYFLDEYISAKQLDKGILAVRSALKSLVVYMEDVERICASKGGTFVKWSRLQICNEFSMESYRNKLKDIEDNLDSLIEKEKLVKWLKPELLRMIQEEPGVLQSDLKKRFDSALQPEVSNQLYLLNSKDLIRREKSGRSYKLYIG